MSKDGIIEHTGTVSRIGTSDIDVVIEAREACGSCAAKGACGMGEGNSKTVTVKVSSPDEYFVGEEVNVYMEKSAGLKSVALAYLAPFFVVVAVLAIMLKSGVKEAPAALLSLGFLVVYYVLLFVFRKRIGETIYFYVDKL